MGVIEYRDDDRRDIGYCPKCHRRLSNLTTEGRGYCEEHEWVFANWNPSLRRYELSAWVTVLAKDENEALSRAREIVPTHPATEVTLSIDDGEPIDVTEDWA